MSKKLTNDEFIVRCVDKHGDKYSYEKVIYVGALDKVEIYCNTCKEYFFIQACIMIGKGIGGCQKCARESHRVKMGGVNQEEFIKLSKEIHGEKTYNYDKVEYTTNKNKVDLKCNVCGTEFKQGYDKHITRKHGCPICGLKKLWDSRGRETNESFIKRAVEIHGDKYDYSEVEYVYAENKVKIFCKKHKSYFEKTPNKHLSCKQGCPICGKESIGDKNKMSQSNFIKRANQKHGFGRYDYSKVVYERGVDKIIIRCNNCGIEFSQTASNHLTRGCINCSSNKPKNTDIFITEAIEKHGYRYDYSKVNYTGIFNSVTIICDDHGEFEQLAKSHLNGNNCPLCSSAKNISETKIKNNTINFFKNEKVDYQVRLPWLGLQSFDLYFHEYNIAIEYQGKQHFESVSIFGGEKGFSECRERDIRKYNLCIENNCKLFYFTYTPIEIKDYPYYVYSDESELFKDITKEIELRKSI